MIWGLCMYAYVYICVCICMRMYVYICMDIDIYVYLFVVVVCYCMNHYVSTANFSMVSIYPCVFLFFFYRYGLAFSNSLLKLH